VYPAEHLNVCHLRYATWSDDNYSDFAMIDCRFNDLSTRAHAQF
jgi:hypothetical protein